KFATGDADVKALAAAGQLDWVRSPNDKPIGSPDASRSTAHGGFDDDPATLRATLARIAGRSAAKKPAIVMHASEQLRRGRRLGIDDAMTERRTTADGGRVGAGRC